MKFKNTAIFASAVMFVSAGLASAADVLPGPAYHDTPVASDWDGFFAGVHAGYANADRNGCYEVLAIDIDCNDLGFLGDTFDYDQDGWVMGAQGGYNWMASSNLLLGAEVDVSVSDVSGDLSIATIPGIGDIGGVGTWTSLASATAKAGWAAGPNLFYVEGGYAIADYEFDGTLGCDFETTHSGPVAGVGFARKVSQNVSVNLEYNRLWLGTENASCSTLFFVAIPTQVETDADMDVVKINVNYHFGN